MRTKFTHLKILYELLAVREKLLLFLFFLSLFALFFTSSLRRGVMIKDQWQHAKLRKAEQYLWLNNESKIQSELERSLKLIDPTKTYNKEGFIGIIDEIARENSQQYRIETPQVHSGEIFDAHSLHITFSNATLEELMAFENAIYRHKPYLSLETLKILPNKNNPYSINAQVSIIALQLKTAAE